MSDPLRAMSQCLSLAATGSYSSDPLLISKLDELVVYHVPKG